MALTCFICKTDILMGSMGIPGVSDSKESACNVGDPGSKSWVRKIPWRRDWLLTPVFLPGEFHRQKAVHMVNSQTQLTLSLFTFSGTYLIVIMYTECANICNIYLAYCKYDINRLKIRKSLGQQGDPTKRPKGNQSWIFIGKTDAEAPILWPPDVKS